MADNKKNKTQTGGLQEKKVKTAPTKEEVKTAEKEAKAKRKEKKAERKKNKVGFWRRVRDFFGELRKIRWATFGLTLKKTGVVIVVVIIFALVVFGIDQGLGALFHLLTKGLA